MPRRITSLAHLSALDVAGRVIRYSRNGGRTWEFGRLTGQSENAVDTQASGMGIIIARERNQPVRRTVLTAHDFSRGIIVEQATVDDAMGRVWWD